MLSYTTIILLSYSYDYANNHYNTTRYVALDQS
jgi:hypothetical protein